MSIDPKTAYWTGALINMAFIASLLYAGVRAIRSRRVRRHKRFMLSAASLVGLFLVSYIVKLVFLGREQLELWSPADVWVLRFHEACIACMVLGGVVAVFQAFKLGLLSERSHEFGAARTRFHRRAGWTAIVGASLGILAAAWVLQGMYAR